MYWHDFETGRSGFSDTELPDGPLVEEIPAREFYERGAADLAGVAYQRPNDDEALQ